MLFCGRLFPTAWLYYHPLLSLSTPFLNFFISFFNALIATILCSFTATVLDSLFMLPFFLLYVKLVFLIFSKISFCFFLTLYIVKTDFSFPLSSNHLHFFLIWFGHPRKKHQRSIFHLFFWRKDAFFTFSSHFLYFCWQILCIRI